MFSYSQSLCHYWLSYHLIIWIYMIDSNLTVHLHFYHHRIPVALHRWSWTLRRPHLYLVVASMLPYCLSYRLQLLHFIAPSPHQCQHLLLLRFSWSWSRFQQCFEAAGAPLQLVALLLLNFHHLES